MQQEDEIVRLKDAKTSKELAEIFNVAPSTIRSVWQRRGVTKFKRTTWLEVKPRLDANWTRTKIAKELNTSKRTIKAMIKENNYKEPQEEIDKWIPFLTRYMSKDEVRKVCGRGVSFILSRNEFESLHQKANHSFFDHIGRRQAYWIGFLLADGNVYNRNNGKTRTLSLNLQYLDREIIQELYRNLGGGNISYNSREGEYGQNLNYISYQLNSFTICKVLEGYNISPAKTKELKYPKNIDPIRFGDVLRGIVDGDGSIIGSGVKQSGYRIAISGQIGFLENIQAELKQRGIGSNVTKDYRSENGGSLDIYSAIDKGKFLELVYPDFKRFGLKRKKAKCKVLKYIIDNNRT